MASLKIYKTLFYLSIVLFGLYPLIPERYESYVPIIFIAASFIFFISSIKYGVMWRPLIIMSSPFVVFFISCLLSDNLYLGFKKIETMLSLIALPIVCFWFLKNTKLDFVRIRSIFFKSFFISNIIYSIIAFYLLSFYKNPKFSSKDADFLRNAITDIPYIGDHPIYISLFLAIGIIIGTNIFKEVKGDILIKIGVIVGQLVLISMLLMLMSKGVIIALIFALLVPLISIKKISKKIIFGSLIIIALVFILLPKHNNRFIELLNKESFEQVDIKNSTSIRFYILKCSIKMAIEEPLFGHGLGDVQNELDLRYNINETIFPSNKYNSHNQYLFVWLSSGIIGLIFFLLFLYYIFNVAVKSQDYFLLSILILFLVSFLFENILSRQSGVILFSFLLNLLVLKNLILITENLSSKF